MIPRLLLVGLVAGSAGLSGCGRQGNLDRPAPLFGAKAHAQYEANQAAKKAGEDLGKDGNAKPNASGANNAGDDTDVVAPPKDDSTTTPLPQRTAPITGSSPDPFGSGPQGALPNPYANPNRSQ
jgi:hypothetical protein